MDTTFETHGILSATTGILMGDIGALYAVASFLLDRPAFTHELAHYGDAMRNALVTAHPELPTEATGENWQQVRDAFVATHGATFALHQSLKGVLADEKDPITTLREMGFAGEVIVIQA